MAYPVGLSMIVRNEEDNIGPCLQSVADLVTEIVVVDTGSTDRTKEYATQFGARVVDFPWCDDFSAARNATLDRLSAPWIFWMDADDRLDEENRVRLQSIFASLAEGNVGYIMKYFSPRESGTARASITEHLRLFRNLPTIRWTGRVHEQIRKPVLDAGGELRDTDVVIRHLGYYDGEIRRQKAERNLRLLLKQLDDDPTDSFVFYNIGQSSLVLERKAEAFEFFERSFSLAPPDAPFLQPLYVHLVGGLYDQNRFHEALVLCRRGLAIFGGDAELLFHEASLTVEIGDLPLGERLFRQWLTLPLGEEILMKDPNLPYKARQNLACVYLRQGRVAEGEAELHEIL